MAKLTLSTKEEVKDQSKILVETNLLKKNIDSCINFNQTLGVKFYEINKKMHEGPW